MTGCDEQHDNGRAGFPELDRQRGQSGPVLRVSSLAERPILPRMRERGHVSAQVPQVLLPLQGLPQAVLLQGGHRHGVVSNTRSAYGLTPIPSGRKVGNLPVAQMGNFVVV